MASCISSPGLPKRPSNACQLGGRGDGCPSFRAVCWNTPLLRNPFSRRTILGVLANYLTTEQCIGRCVILRRSHCADDFYTGNKVTSRQRNNVDKQGRLHTLASTHARWFFRRTTYHRTVKSSGVHGRSKIEHSYPPLLALSQPVIFRATEQWFISMKPGGRHTLPSARSDEIKK